MFLKEKGGFSLVEVMVSMVILAFGILGIIGMFSIADNALYTSNHMTMALRLAQEKLESKKGASFELLILDDMDGDGLMETKMADDATGGDDVAGDGIYTGSDIASGVSRRWTIGFNSPQEEIARIEVVTSWIDKNGAEHSITLSTIKADGGYR